MSVVSNVILKLPTLEDEKISEIRDWLVEHGYMSEKDEVKRLMGHGYKVVEQDTYIFGFNCFIEDEFVAFLKSIDWEYPEELQLFICDQHENRYRLVL